MVFKLGQAMKSKLNQGPVVVILPYAHGKILMQLRDEKKSIAFPGHWSFFGGSIEKGESPMHAALREIQEEISLRPSRLLSLGCGTITELDGLVAHAFACPLLVPVQALLQREGLDCGLFSLHDILSGVLYSDKMQKTYPVVPVQYVQDTLQKLFGYINHDKK